MPLKKFVTPLAIRPALKPIRRGSKGTFYQVKMTQFKQKLHRDLPLTTVWDITEDPRGLPANGCS